MGHYNTVFNQLQHLLPRHQFDRIVSSLDGDRYVKTFKTWGQFTTLLYAQASGKQSLREIETGLATQGKRLYHLGLPEKVSRSTVADANAKRDYRIYERFFYELLGRCRDLTPKHKFRFANPLYSLDSTSIELAVNAFPWARYAKRQGAIKMHCLFEHGGQIPAVIAISDAKQHDIEVGRTAFPIIPDSIYCFDRGYLDYTWYRRITEGKAFFVTRARSSMVASFVGQQKATQKPGVWLDAVIEMPNPAYPYRLRLVAYYDSETGKYFEFLTNNFELAARTIAGIYKARWQVETFFRWIKQNLKIKTFLGTSKNAVLTQVWVAMCYYLMLAYVKYQARYGQTLFYLHRMIRETLLEKASLFDLLRLTERRLDGLRRQEPQLCLQL